VSRAFATNPTVTFAAAMFRAYALHGPNQVNLRLTAAEQVNWFESCVAACRQIDDRQGEAAALADV
jgi:hypothetical protein